jgi:hypothetical protein
MIRSWGFVTLTGAAQPCFGDVLTAAMAATDGQQLISVSVASTARYVAGDRIVIEPGTTNQDILLVQGVKPGGTTVLLCDSEGGVATKAHANSSIIQLSIACGAWLLTPAPTAGLVYIGTSSTVTNVGGGSAFSYTSGGGNYNLGFPQWNTVRTSDAWMAGAAADMIGVAAFVV